MQSERERGFEPLTAESVRESREGLVEDEAIAELLDGTAWDHRQRHTRVGTAHVFTRPVTLLESARLEPEEYQNHRHTLGVRRPDRPGGEPLLTYLVLRDVHSSDLRALPEIESSLHGRGQVTRDDFTELELAILDRIWLPTPELRSEVNTHRAGEPAITESQAQDQISSIERRLRIQTRAATLVFGMREGFINPELERFRHPAWPALTDRLSKTVRSAHLNGPDMTRRLNVSHRKVGNQVRDCYAKTGARTKGELTLMGLANEEYRLGELSIPTRKVRLSAMHHEMLSLVGEPRATVAERVDVKPNAVKRRYAIIGEKVGTNKEGLALYAFQESLVDNDIDPGLAEVLTEAQRSVVRILLTGTDRIADELSMTPKQVRGHTHRAMRKLGLHTRSGLVLYGLRAGLIDPDQPLPLTRRSLTPRAGRA